MRFQSVKNMNLRPLESSNVIVHSCQFTVTHNDNFSLMILALSEVFHFVCIACQSAR